MTRTDSKTTCFSAWKLKLGPLRQINVLLLLLCSFVLKTQAQVELLADSNHVETGNPLVLRLRLPVASGKPDSIIFDAWAQILPPQNIVLQTEWQMLGTFYEKTITALFFEADSLKIPPLLVFQKGNTLYSNPLQIVVMATPSPDDLNDMAPIKEIHREPAHWTDYLPWILGAIAVVSLLGVLFWMANCKPQTRIQSRKMEIPAHQLALKKIEVLIQKNWIAKGLVKAHYAELTFILREYLEKRYSIPVLESTTAESLGYLKSSDLPGHLFQPLQILLEQADLIKFAKIVPPESFHEETLALSRSIILDSSPSVPNAPAT